MPSWETMDVKTYENVFWGGDLGDTKGFETLVKRNSESKKMLNDLEEYLKRRSKLEAEYSKNLTALAKYFKQRDDLGVLEATLNLLKSELESMARYHNKAANNFQQHGDTVKRFKDDQTNRRKAHEESLNKLQQSKLSQLSKTVQSEKVYVKKCSERDAAQLSFKEISTSNQQVKEIDKARNKLTKATEEAEKADNQYKSAVMVLEECRKLWEQEMINVCQSVQVLDEERIKFMRREIWDAVNIDSQLALDIDQSCETVREVLEKCDIVSDIQAFMNKFSTGETRPEQFVYKHYTHFQNNSDNDSSGSDTYNPYSTVNEVTTPTENSSSGKAFFSFTKKKGS